MSDAEAERIYSLYEKLEKANEHLDLCLKAFKCRDLRGGDKNHDFLLGRCYRANKDFTKAHEEWLMAELLRG